MNKSRTCRYDDSSYFQKDGETREEWRRRLNADIDKDKENMIAEESAAHNKKMDEFKKLLSSNKANSVTVEDANKKVGFYVPRQLRYNKVSTKEACY